MRRDQDLAECRAAGPRPRHAAGRRRRTRPACSRADRARFCAVRERIALAMLALTTVSMPSRRLGDREASSPANRCDHRPRSGRVELHGAAQEPVGIEAARARHWRRSPSAACRRGHRPRVPARRRRMRGPTRNAPPLSTPGDRAAAGADRVDVDHRHQDREAADPGVSRRRFGEPAAGDDADIGRGAADIEGDEVVARPTARRPMCRRARRPPGRTASSAPGAPPPSRTVAAPPFEPMTCSSPPLPAARSRRDKSEM